MTNEQKQWIAELRSMGVSYAKIGVAIGISGDTVKTYCCGDHMTVKQKCSARKDFSASLIKCIRI